MATSIHGSQQNVDGIHGIVGLGPYANEAARLAASVQSTDIHKVAFQTDTNGWWVLLSNSPIAWRKIAGPTPMQTESTTARTLALTDAGKYVRCTNGSATTVTVPPNASVAFNAGDTIIVMQAGAGQVTLSPGAGVTLNHRSSLTTKGQFSPLSLIYVGGDVWDVAGDET